MRLRGFSNRKYRLTIVLCAAAAVVALFVLVAVAIYGNNAAGNDGDSNGTMEDSAIYDKSFEVGGNPAAETGASLNAFSEEGSAIFAGDSGQNSSGMDTSSPSNAQGGISASNDIDASNPGGKPAEPSASNSTTIAPGLSATVPDNDIDAGD